MIDSKFIRIKELIKQAREGVFKLDQAYINLERLKLNLLSDNPTEELIKFIEESLANIKAFQLKQKEFLSELNQFLPTATLQTIAGK